MPRTGRPLKYEPTDKDHKLVEAMAACGVPQDDIAKVVGMGEKALRRYFRDALDKASLRANAKVAATLFAMATSGENTAATLFWMKCRLGWKETSITEISGLEGKPVAIGAVGQLAHELESLHARIVSGTDSKPTNGIPN